MGWNPVAKHAGTFNKAVTHRDRKNDFKREQLGLLDCLAEMEEERTYLTELEKFNEDFTES